MSEDLGEGTMTGEHDPPDMESPETKIHGEAPPGSPMPGVEEPGGKEVKKEINPNTE